MPLPLLVAPIIDALLGAGKEVIDRTVPDKVAAEKAKQELEAKAQEQSFQELAQQVAVNLEEAKSTNWFVAGWRPFVGWICGCGLAYVAILEPIGRFVAEVGFGYKGPFPVIDTSLTMQVLLGMLGLAGIRGFEKSKGVARK